jgi:hypothetical protein
VFALPCCARRTENSAPRPARRSSATSRCARQAAVLQRPFDPQRARPDAAAPAQPPRRRPRPRADGRRHHGRWRRRMCWRAGCSRRGLRGDGADANARPRKVAILRSNAIAHRTIGMSYNDVFKPADVTPVELREATDIALKIANRLLLSCGLQDQRFTELPRACRVFAGEGNNFILNTSALASCAAPACPCRSTD